MARADKHGGCPSEGIGEFSRNFWLTIAVTPPPLFFVSVASKRLSNAASLLESTLVRGHGSVDSKGSYGCFCRTLSQVLILNHSTQGGYSPSGGVKAPEGR